MLSEHEVETFLRSRLGQGVSAIQPIGHGEWSKAFAFDCAGVGYVARFSALREDFAKDQLAAGFRSPDLPIPPIVALGEAFDGYYAIAERVEGAYLDHLDEPGLRRVLPRLLAALDAARAVDLTGSTGYGIWDASGSAPHPTWRAALLDVANDRPTDRLHGWRTQLRASPTGVGPFDLAYQRLQSLIEFAPATRHLIHSDLLHFNVLVANDRLTAVLDWGCAMYGDFLYDIAWFTFWAPWFPAWRRLDFRHEAAHHFATIGLDPPHFDQRLQLCQAHIGLSSQAYCAFKGYWDDLAAITKRTLEVTEPS